MTTLVIAEKPELGRAIAKAYGGNFKNISNSYLDNNSGIKVIWCYGHMLELKKPEDYDPNMKIWKMNDLPYENLLQMDYKISEGKEDQTNLIIKLAHEANTIIHAGDPDGEGQRIVDEIIEYGSIKTKVKRVLINDNNTSVIQRSLENLKDNSEFKKLSEMALARSAADLLAGINLTCAYSIKYNRLLTVGRVLTPILSLVVARTNENKNFKPVDYAEASAKFDFEGIEVDSKLIINDSLKDEDDLVTKKENIELLKGKINSLPGMTGSVIDNQKEKKKRLAPLPYNLIKLQIDCSNKFNYSADQVLKITQTLREDHQLITYNRSDSRYLNDEHHADSPLVLESIVANLSELKNIVDSADSQKKGRAFNSSKVTAHHAIIPTQKTLDLSLLTEEEKNVYELIAKRYVAQFLTDREYFLTTVKIQCEDLIFHAQAQEEIQQGWRVLIDEEEEEESITGSLSGLTLENGLETKCAAAEVNIKKTRAPRLYTEATLLSDLTQVSKYVQDPELKKILIEKDKGKEGESGGIGTPATRSTILKNLFDREYLTKDKKNIVPTAQGFIFYDLLPKEIKYPDLTARWQRKLNDIEEGALGVVDFIDSVHQDIQNHIKQMQSIPNDNPFNDILCECGGVVRKIKGNDSEFWSCSNYKECGIRYQDQEGKPIKEITYPCECGGNIRQIQGEKNKFWSCSNYKECDIRYQDQEGKPIKEITYPCECGGNIRQIQGEKNKFWGCNNKDCQIFYTERDGKPEAVTTYPCEKDGCNGQVRSIVGKKGEFWSCSNYKKCKSYYVDSDGKPQLSIKPEGKKKKTVKFL